MVVNTKIVLPVALGLSLVTVTAFVVYYIFKKDEEDEKIEERKAVTTAKVNVIEVSVPKKIVPALIGRNGSNIKNIESKSGALIHFKKFSDKDYDVCIIRGRNTATQLAETFIHDFIKQQPDIVDENILVPSWACGRIIGSGGENINDISHRSGARVKIDGSMNGDNNQRTVSIRGTKEQIEVAKGLIQNCVALEKCRREIEQSKRAPRVSPQSPPTTPTPTADETPGDRAKPIKCKPHDATSSIEVYVSAVSSPSRFWVQFVGPQVAQLDDLVAHMTEYYGNKDNRAAHALSSVSVGQVVAAVFRHDGRWYRARVHDIRPNEFDATQQVADVFYLDYGDSEYVATHELCELRADLLRLRFQAMECFLAGVKPAEKEKEGETEVSNTRPRWHPQAVERFEELTQVARWKPLLSKTCTYNRSANLGEKEKEIPGIKLYDVTDDGSVDVGEMLVTEGWAEVSQSPRPSPPRARPTPFGDLGNSKVLGMLGPRAASPPHTTDTHTDTHTDTDNKEHKDDNKENERLTESTSLTKLDSADKLKSISNFDLSYPDNMSQPHLNGSHEDFLAAERDNLDREATESLLPPVASKPPSLSKLALDETKANINRIDSHHNLENMGKHEK